MTMAFVMINTLPDQTEPVLEKVKGIKFVKEAHMLDGDYNLVAVIKTETDADFHRTLGHIRKVKGISSIIFLETMK
jgi:DNA-binding Lrp family transcriptional regulator